MAKEKAWQRHERRKSPNHQRRNSFCIFTEGKTEELYFDGFDLPTLRVKCVGLGGGNAEHLLQEALGYMRMAKYADYDYYWLVFDCDDNSQEELQRVIAKAERNKVHWCFSNPCFELWYLLHFVYRDTPLTASDLKKRLLKEWIPGYNETMEGVWKLLSDKTDVAVRHALRLLPYETRDEWKQKLQQANPLTNVDELVLKLLEKD